MPEKDPIVARFTPQFDGSHLKGVPQKDLTQREIDTLNPIDRRDAFAPHPLYGKPLYTMVDEEETPRWFSAKLDQAQADGIVIPMRLPHESQRAYDARVATETAPPVDAGIAVLSLESAPQDGEA